MTVEITQDTVLAAIADGHTDVDQLAAHFGVNHTNPWLRNAIYDLWITCRIAMDATTKPNTLTVIDR